MPSNRQLLQLLTSSVDRQFHIVCRSNEQAILPRSLQPKAPQSEEASYHKT